MCFRSQTDSTSTKWCQGYELWQPRFTCLPSDMSINNTQRQKHSLTCCFNTSHSCFHEMFTFHGVRIRILVYVPLDCSTWMPVMAVKQFSGNNCAETAVSFALKDQEMINDVNDFYNLKDQQLIDHLHWKVFYNLAWVCGYTVCYIAMQDNISSQSSLHSYKIIS